MAFTTLVTTVFTLFMTVDMVLRIPFQMLVAVLQTAFQIDDQTPDIALSTEDMTV